MCYLKVAELFTGVCHQKLFETLIENYLNTCANVGGGYEVKNLIKNILSLKIRKSPTKQPVHFVILNNCKGTNELM